MKNRATDTIHQTILRFVQCQGQKADLTAGSSENHILKGFFRIPEDRTTDSTLYFRTGTCLSSAPRTTPHSGCGQHQGQGRGRGSPQSPGLRSKGQNLVTQSQFPLQLVTDLSRLGRPQLVTGLKAGRLQRTFLILFPNACLPVRVPAFD